MKIKVVEPQVWMLTSLFDARKQLALCAYAAGLSRGRFTDGYILPPEYEGGGQPYVGDPLDTNKHIMDYEEAEDLLQKLLSHEPYPHESVIEHGSVSFLFQCSRIATHEIVRHRLCAFTQTSTRYIEEKDEVTFIKPPHMLGKAFPSIGEYEFRSDVPYDDGAGSFDERPPDWVKKAVHAVYDYRALRDGGIRRESARYLLPHCLSCWIQVTANFRQLRHMVRFRTSKRAAPEMQKLFNMVESDLSEISSVLTEGL